METSWVVLVITLEFTSFGWVIEEAALLAFTIAELAVPTVWTAAYWQIVPRTQVA